MRTYFRRTDWPYWAGTIDDLLRPAEIAERYVGDLTHEPVDVETTVSLPGQQIDTDSIAELRESLRDHDIPAIETIVIKIGNAKLLRVDLDVAREWGTAVRLRTRGTDEVAVDGLHSTTARELDRGRRISYGRLLAIRLGVGLIVGIALPVAILASGAVTLIPTGEIGGDLFGTSEIYDWQAAPWVIPTLFALPIIGFLVASWGHTLAIKDLELLRQGEGTRYSRVKGVVWAGLATLILGPLAGIAWALFLGR